MSFLVHLQVVHVGQLASEFPHHATRFQRVPLQLRERRRGLLRVQPQLLHQCKEEIKFKKKKV